MSDIELATASNVSLEQGGSTWKDWLGITASVGCAIHCAAMPFVIAYLPSLGLSFLADEAFHKWMALACFLIAICAFVPGIRKHGSWWPMSVGAIGIGVITFGAFGVECDCCPTCADVDQTSRVAEDDCDCEQCQSAQQESTDQLAENPLSNGSLATTGASIGPVLESEWMKKLASWVTPLGGFLLVTAHLLNRRFGCMCGCCATASVEKLESAKLESA